ncbi:ABC transporter ATP-binding protein/permease [bacterium 210917-DFI.7.65]|nr:ABC transporter ATP-binding protein/permease [bacterium 210917-DFI.7.65]
MIKKLWPYLRPYKKWFILGIICSAAEAVFELLIPLVMARIVDVGIQSGDASYTVRMGALMVAMALVSLGFGISAAYLSAKTGQGFGANLRAAEYDRIQEYSFSNIERFSTASLITRLTSDINAMQLTMMMGMRLLVRAPVMLVSALVLSLLISVQLSRVFLVAIPILAIVVFLILLKVGPLFRKLQEKTDSLNLSVQENLTAIRVVKSFVREDYEKQKFDARNTDLRRASETAFGRVVINMPIMMLVIYGSIIAIMWFGGHMVDSGTLEIGLLTTFFTYVGQILVSLMMVSMIFMMLTRSVACGRRIVEVLDETPDINDDHCDTTARVKDGSIRFDHVYFKYDPNSPEWNLEDINLDIEAGQTIGIIGGTGSAKSTLVQLIPRLYEATKGNVSVGGRDVRRYSMEHLRDSCAMVLQKNTLFSGTVRENLLWGNENATQEEIEQACRIACVDEFIDRLANGYDTDLGQGGVNVSGGQKQRLCIARALLKKPKVLILDDSTSAVDMATDAKIRRAFATELKKTTKIIIAQRIASVCDADQIIVMDDGKISAVGKHEDLMENSEIYRDVYLSQQEGGNIDG